MQAPDHVATMRASWGEEPPRWVLLLAEECARTSQNQAAKRIGKSASYISQILRRKYLGDMKAAEEIVLGVLDSGSVVCPALGNIPGQECHEWRSKARKFAPTNSKRVRMFKACQKCDRFKGGE